jgi:hypothetical protein
MKDEWEQFPPIEGNDSTLSSLALIGSIVFVVGMIIYVFCL